MTSHHDKSKINFLCSLGETWSATPGPRKHPVLAPSSQQSLTHQASRSSSCLVAISPRSLGPPEPSWPSISRSNGQDSPLPSYGAALRWDLLRHWSFRASSSQLRHGSTDRSVALALRSYSDHTPSVQIQHRRGYLRRIFTRGRSFIETVAYKLQGDRVVVELSLQEKRICSWRVRGSWIWSSSRTPSSSSSLFSWSP